MLKYYHVNPDNWEFDETYPIYSPEYGVRYYFKFSYLDYLFHYKKFYRNYKRDKKEANQLKITEKFLNHIQDDINQLKQQANEEIKQANNIKQGRAIYDVNTGTVYTIDEKGHLIEVNYNDNY